MTYHEIVGLLVVALIAIGSFYLTIRKTIIENNKPIEDLNINIVRLNANFENLLEKTKNQETRIDKHCQEIDRIIESQRNSEKDISGHEARIRSIERKLDL